jgi:hypothetical protein
VNHTSTQVPATRSGNELRALLVYLGALVGREPAGRLEVRARRGAGMSQRVYASRSLGAAAAAITRLAQHTDVYVGCAPRRRRPGGLDAVARVWVLWVDCDTEDAVERLAAFTPAPAIVVRSGTGENRHAYWPLTGPLDVAYATSANQRLAHALGADTGAVTTAAAILRPPGTLNFKHDPPAPVVAERLRPWQRISAARLVGELPDPPDADARPVIAGRRPGAELADGDPLRQLPPAIYVRPLTGRAVGRDHKIACPFHGEDHVPSLHVYDAPERGWYCFGCGRGGSIYDLAAEVYGLSPRGRDFVELRARLQHALAAWAPETAERERRG